MHRICLLTLFSLCAATAQQPFASVARQTFADLLKNPLQHPSLSPTIHSQRVEEGLVIEDVSWPTLDDQTVPAFVIRPADAKGPLPAVICLHGSSGSRDSMTTSQFGPGEWTRNGRDAAHTRMLGWARELARRGYVVLAMTQRGLDDRGVPINTQSNALLVQGRTGMGAVLHEIRQAVTYLDGRTDVGKIGITGMSFGGITSFYTWIVDDRIAAAAPICGGVGSLESFIQLGSLSYHGTYWWLPGMLLKGDHGDFASALAPRPLMVWAPTEDIGMPREGVDHFRAQVQPAYAQAGASEALVIHQPSGKHSFTLEAFEAMDAFFRDHLR